MKDWSEIESLQTPQDCVNVGRANHAINPFEKRVPWPLHVSISTRLLVIARYGFYARCLLTKVETYIKQKLRTCSMRKHTSLMLVDPMSFYCFYKKRTV